MKSCDMVPTPQPFVDRRDATNEEKKPVHERDAEMRV